MRIILDANNVIHKYRVTSSSTAAIRKLLAGLSVTRHANFTNKTNSLYRVRSELKNHSYNPLQITANKSSRSKKIQLQLSTGYTIAQTDPPRSYNI